MNCVPPPEVNLEQLVRLQTILLSDFQQVEKTVGKKLMTIVVELIHPYTKVFVDYDNAETLYLLNAYDSMATLLALQSWSKLGRQCRTLLS